MRLQASLLFGLASVALIVGREQLRACVRAAADGARAACLVRVALAALGVGFLLPLAVTCLAERAARRRFLLRRAPVQHDTVAAPKGGALPAGERLIASPTLSSAAGSSLARRRGRSDAAQQPLEA